MSFRDELIEAGARAVHAAVWDRAHPELYGEEQATAALDAMLAHRSTVECGTCGGTGKRMRYDNRDQYHDPCPDCTDGRVPRPERLAVVGEQVGWRGRLSGWENRINVPLGSLVAMADRVPVFILAPDLPEGTETCPRCGGTGDVGPRDERGEGVWVDCPVCCIEDPRCAECGRAESRHGSGIRAGILHAFQKPIVPSPADTPNEPPRAQMAPDLPEGTP
jgi:hypothetical protein